MLNSKTEYGRNSLVCQTTQYDSRQWGQEAPDRGDQQEHGQTPAGRKRRRISDSNPGSIHLEAFEEGRAGIKEEGHPQTDDLGRQRGTEIRQTDGTHREMDQRSQDQKLSSRLNNYQNMI